MRPLHYIALFAATLSTATAQSPALRFIIDAPGIGYREIVQRQLKMTPGDN
jgi:hypothetical protein